MIVDLRVNSPTFLRMESIPLSENDGQTIFIPTGVGHGFSCISDSALVVYLTSSKYNSNYEKSINPLDPQIGVDWKIPDEEELVISESDQQAPSLAQVIKLDNLPRYLYD